MDDEATNHFIKAVKTININIKVKDKKRNTPSACKKKKFKGQNQQRQTEITPPQWSGCRYSLANVTLVSLSSISSM